MLRTAWRITTRAFAGFVSMPASALSEPNVYACGTDKQDQPHRGRWQT
jgi:hypothetical protein